MPFERLSVGQFYTKTGTSQLFRVGEDGEELAVGQPPDTYMDSEILTAAASYSPGGDWISGSGVTSQLVLPVAKVCTPRLRRNTWLRWVIVGDYENPTPNNTTIEAQLMVDAVATGTAFSWVQNGAVTSPGAFIFIADLYSLATPGATRHILDVKPKIINASGVAVIGGATSNTELSQIYSLNPLVDQTLGFQIRKSVAGAGAILAIQSIGCVQFLKTTGP